MREIKFRAWDKGERKMYYNVQDEYDSTFPPFATLLNNDFIEIMQFTGLKDKKGIDMYEGDICEWSDTSKSKLTIVWGEKEGCWCYYFIGRWGNQKEIYPLMLHPKCERYYEIEHSTRLKIENHINKVIGNIYENPELIE